jgi:gliding motility-associated-like protein
MKHVYKMMKRTALLIFTLLATPGLVLACDTSGYDMNSITDNGDGTFTIQWTALVAGGTTTGVGSTWGFYLNIDATILSISPTSFTSANGTTLNAAINGGNVQWGNPNPSSNPPFLDITLEPNDQSFNFTMVVQGIPTEWWGGGQEANLCPGGAGTFLDNYEGEFPCFEPVLIPNQDIVFACPGDVVTLSVTPNYLVEDILWSPGNSTSTSITVTAFSDETYTITGSNPGCSTSTTISISMLPLPYMTPQEEMVEVCEGTPAVLVVNTEFVDVVTWTPTNTSGPVLVVTPPNGPSVYTATGTNSCGSITVEIEVNTLPFPTITTSNDQVICQGESVQLIANPSGGAVTTWIPDGTVANSITVSPTSTTTYTAVASNFCGAAVEDVVVTVVGNTTNTVNLSACVGETVLYNGLPLAAGSSSQFTFNNYAGCDSVVTVVVASLPNTTGNLTLTACQGETVNFLGQNLAPGSTTQFTLNAFNGCDSVLTVFVQPLQNYTSSLNLQACAGESVTYAGQQLPAGSVTPITFNAFNGCDSVVTVTVQSLPNFVSSLTLQTCTGTTVSYNGQQLSPNSTTLITLTAQNGCDSVVTVTVQELAVLTSTLDVQTCTGTTYNYNGQQLQPGTSTPFNLVTASGCDSVVTVNVTAVAAFQESLSFNACTGETIPYNGQNLQPGTTTPFNFTSVQGCDSIVTVTVVQLPTFTSNLSLQTCTGTPIVYAGQSLPPGSVTPITLAAQNGCDSVVTVTVNEIQVLTSTLNLTACPGTNAFYQGQSLAPGSSTPFNFTSTIGCDSIVTVNVTALQSYATTVELEACEGFTASYNGFDLAPGTDLDFNYTASNGCDSVVTVTVAEVESFQTLEELFTCPGTTAEYLGQDLAIGSINQFSYTAAAGCDSVVTVTVSALPTFASTLTLEACEGSSVTYNGQSIMAGTSGVFTLAAQNGCDSTVTVNVTEIAPITSNLTLQACGGSTVTYEGEQLAPGSTTDFTFTALSNGCDSIVTVFVQEVNVITTSLTLFACPGNTVTYNGQPLPPNSNTPFSFVTAQGCDSVVTVSVLPLQASSGALTLTACTGTTATYNNQQLQPGTSTNFTFPNWQGCDSTVTVMVVEAFPQAIVVNLQACTGTTITYNGQTLQPGTSTEIMLDTWQGCDSLVTVFVEELDILTGSVTLQGCEGQPLTYNGTVIPPNSSMDFTFTSVNGCDSIVTVTALPSVPVLNTEELIEICEGATAIVFDQPISLPGVYAQTFTSGGGCDSTHTVTVAIVDLVNLEFPSDITIQLGETTTLDPVATPPTGLTYTWQPDPSLSCTDCPNPVASPISTTKYYLSVEDEGGCDDSDEITVFVKRPGVYIPNSFSPNGDGINDVFTIFSDGRSVKRVVSLKIFSRWGESVFEFYDFPPDDFNYGWDGSHREEEMDVAVFVYYTEVEFLDGKKQLLKGDVTLVR